MLTTTIDITKEPTAEQIKILEDAMKRPVTPDEDCPELSEEELLQFSRIANIRQAERKKQTVTLRLSPQALKTARSLGKGYTSVLSRILESALMDKETIKRFL
ncbi:MAG: BrnA antitoxin family protein [Clostridiales bacterium]|nr:BrnA antitoxin family protein [Clostridiales bacterium]